MSKKSLNSELKTPKHNFEIKKLKEYIKVLESKLQSEEKFSENLHTLDLYNKTIMQFGYTNLPADTMTSLIIERQMFTQGKLAFFKSPKFGYLCLPFVFTGGLNDYNMYTRLHPLSITGQDYGELLIDEECVIIRDNPYMLPPIIYASFYGDAISDCYNTKTKNRNFLKLPFLFRSTGDRAKDEANALEIQHILGDNVDIAVITQAFEQLELFDLKPQYFGRELEESIKDYKNAYLEWAGIPHLPIEKNERMLVDEVNINIEATNLDLAKRLNTRKEAIDKINKLYGLNIEVFCNYKDYNDIKVNTENRVSSIGGRSTSIINS